MLPAIALGVTLFELVIRKSPVDILIPPAGLHVSFEGGKRKPLHDIGILKSVRIHFAPRSNGRSFPFEYSYKFHQNCMVAAPHMLINAGKKLKEA